MGDALLYVIAIVFGVVWIAVHAGWLDCLFREPAGVSRKETEIDNAPPATKDHSEE